jgi:FlaG/FlaF family flagellin (archaellin)
MVAMVLLVAIVVVLAAILFILVEKDLGSTNSHPTLGTALALSNPVFANSKSSGISSCSAMACDFYNMTVQSATSGLQLQDLAFQVVNLSGKIFVPTGGVVALNGAGVVVAQYAFTSERWVSGGTTVGQDDLTIVVYTNGATPQSLSGDTLRVIGVNTYSGSIIVHFS